jgi:hypothetical protein
MTTGADTSAATRMTTWTQGLLLASALLLGACSTATLTPPVTEQPQPEVITLPQPPAAPPVTPEPPPAPTAPPPVSRTPLPPSQPPAATPSSTLLASVDTAIAAGELERAAALCERALRISPRDAVVWYRLATIRFRQQRYSETVDTAQRALSFAGGNAALTRDINRLLQQANAQLN